jgi:myo-inositol 2-dehydrogenase/D-chiro-inositol 1-dehydrogenase
MDGEALVILGCGWIARRHAVAARRLGIPAIFASRDATRARAYAREFGGVGAFGGYAAALADPRASAVIVCTPHDQHLDHVLAALAAGRHVLVEKPMARTLDETDRMLDAARSAGRVLMVAENFRFMPAFRHVRAVLDAGALGALRELSLVARGYRRGSGWRLSSAVSGGGVLIDSGIHYVHALRWWGGEVRRVFALRPRQSIAELGGEDSLDMLAELDDGVVGFLASSVAAPGVPGLQWATLSGARGAAFADNRGRFVLTRVDGRLRVRLFRRDVRGHERMLAVFREAIRSGAAPDSDGVSGRRDLEVVLAAYRSVVEGQPVALTR